MIRQIGSEGRTTGVHNIQPVDGQEHLLARIRTLEMERDERNKRMQELEAEIERLKRQKQRKS